MQKDMLKLMATPDKARGDGVFTDSTGDTYQGTFIANKAYGYCIKSSA